MYLLSVFALSGVLFALSLRGKRPGEAANKTLLSALPEDSFLVATVDMKALRASPLAAPLTSLGVGRLAAGAAISGASAACGFDPAAKIDELAIALPEAEDTGDFGLVMQGAVGRDELVACAQKVILARGGHPTVAPQGAFTFVDDTSVGAKLALHEGGPFLLARGPWLTKMVATVEKKNPSIEESAAHLELRRALGPAAVVLTALLPSKLRDRLRREMNAELTGANGNAAMAGVLAVKAAGVALVPGVVGGTTELTAELRCETGDACTEVKKLVERKRDGWSKDLSFRLLGIGPLIDALAIETHEATLRATTRLPADDARRLIERAIEMTAPRRRPSAPPAPSAPRTPDELVPSRPPVQKEHSPPR